MKKISLIAASVAACALSSAAIAATPQDSAWFGGLVYGQSHLSSDQKQITTGTTTSSISGGLANQSNSYGVRGGFYTNPNTRIYATYTQSKDSSTKNTADKQTIKNKSLLFSADYLFGDQVAKPFIGVSVGANQYKASISGTGSDDSIDLAYGAQAGINWALTPNVALEAGYQYLENNNDVKASTTDAVYKSQLDHTENVYASIDYRF